MGRVIVNVMDPEIKIDICLTTINATFSMLLVYQVHCFYRFRKYTSQRITSIDLNVLLLGKMGWINKEKFKLKHQEWSEPKVYSTWFAIYR